jgi:hypothetical protein
MSAEDIQRERFERNLAALKARYPLAYLRMATITEPVSKLTGSIEGGDLNLDLGHTNFYSTDAVSFAETQVAAFRATPIRFYMDPPPRHDPPPQHQHHVSLALYKHFSAHQVPALPVEATPDGGFMLIYGIGLGFHLPVLFEEMEVRSFIVVEEHLEFLYHALHLHDWAAMLERMSERGQQLLLVFGPEPSTVAAQVHWYMRGPAFGLIDGSYVFRHYASMLLDKAHEEFREKLPLLPVSIGFYEDEQVMLLNGTENLIRTDFLLLDDRPRMIKDIPAVIVGAGPSFDQTIEVLRRIKDQVVIFSCGTSLMPLMRAGIRPDFHCELENVYSSFYQLNAVVEAYGRLDGITLIGASTVTPEMLSLFDEHVLYFRDSVSSTGLWCPDRSGIYGTAPTCTNLALRTAELMAFREIYLFGVDLGTRDASQHHAAGSIYHSNEEWAAAHAHDPIKVMKIEMPGNFGGKAYTNVILHWARMMMGQSIEAFSFAKIYNCSDGVSIPGTLPKLAHTIRLAVPPGRKQTIVKRMKAELERKRAGEMAPLEEIEAVRVAFAGYYNQLLHLIDKTRQAGTGFTDFYEAVTPFLAERGESRFQTVLRSVNVGTFMMCFQIGYYFYRRVSDAERPAAMEVFLTALADRLQEMRESVDGIFVTLVDLKRGHPEQPAG